MKHKLNLMKLTLIGMFTLLMTTLSTNGMAAIQHSNNVETVESQKSTSNFTTTIKRHFQSAKKFTNRKVRQLRKQYNEMSSVKKVSWGMGMVIIGALTIIGSILTLSSWWFVIGLGLIIFGALKIVVGILGIVI